MTVTTSISGLRAGWESREVIHDIDLDIVAGSTLCILGPGGSGKSTLLCVLEEIVGAGGVREGGHGPWWEAQVHSISSGCARFRQHGARSQVPIAELLREAGLLNCEAWMPLADGARASLGAARGLALDAAPEDVRRYVSFALVACSEAPVLLFDEPGFGLAGPWLRAVRRTLMSLPRRGRCVVVVTHNVALARVIADQVILLIDGQVIEAGVARKFFNHSQQVRTRQYLRWGA